LSFFKELKRRNVFKVAAAYIIIGWLIMQAGEVMGPALRLPEWVNSMLAFFLILGFPLAMFFAWAFEMTPEGLKKEKDVDRSRSITSTAGKKLNHTITIVLVLALGLFAFDKFVLDPGRDAAEIATAIQVAQENVVPVVEPAEANNSIAVLPFVNMSSDKEQEYFSDGLSEELLNLLAKIPELRVAARTSSFSFKDQNIEIPEIAARLKVAHVLEGSVRKSGNQIRITAQLIQADNGYQLLSETYDRQLDNIFQIQDEIASAVVEALKITLLGEAPKTKETDPEAYQLYMEGQYINRQNSKSAYPRAITLLNKVLEIDPNYVPAWTELATSYIGYAGFDDLSYEEGFALADNAITRALEIDPDYAPAYSARGSSIMYYRFKFKAGYEDLQHALRLDPGSALVLSSNGFGARVLGRLNESINLFGKSLELDPLMAGTHSFQGWSFIYAGRQDEAESAFRTALTLTPGYSGGHYRLGRVLIRKGDFAEALAEMRKETDAVYRSTGLAMAHHALGNREASQLALNDIIENDANGGAFQIAEVYGFRNEPDKAFEWLEQAVAISDGGVAATLGNPALHSLRTDPRWQPFLEKLGLLEFWLEMPPEWGGPLE
jgi:TolB-like protein/lipoprotein NlpI